MTYEHESEIESGTEPNSDDRTLAAVAHAAGVLSSTLLPLLVPLVIYLIKKDESRFASSQAKEALNFQVTVVLVMLLCVPLILLFGLGFFLMGLTGLASLILSIVAAVKTYEGQPYRYPIALRLF